MDVALVYPEVYDMARFRQGRKEFPPFGVLYLAAALRQAGHRAVVEKVAPDGPPLDLTGFDAVGFSLASSATYGVLLRARRAARISPRTLVMAGGVHANFYPTETLRDFDADVVAVGEGEQLILDLLDRAATRDFTGLPGAVWRRADGTVASVPGRPVSRDISDLPLPARDLLPVDDVVMADRLAGRP
jgi:anaerobic magnesium-protoporphyrin IX monomethyl ester cyclase